MESTKTILEQFKTVYQKELDSIHINYGDSWNFCITQENKKYALSIATPPDMGDYNYAETALIYEDQLMYNDDYQDIKRFENWDELKEEIDIFMQTYWEYKV